MTRAQDLARRINTPLSILHHFWVEKVTGISCRTGDGLDLYDPTRSIGLEVKFSKAEDDFSSISWTVNRHQLDYAFQCKDFFWACGIHYPIKPIHSLANLNSEILERNISFRELYIVRSSWVPQTVTFRLTQGKSKTKEWSSYLGYAYFNNLPPVISSHKVRKGVVYITEGVDERKFNINTGPILSPKRINN